MKQSLRQWYKRFDTSMLSWGFRKPDYDSCVCSKIVNKTIYLLLNVDDMSIATKSMTEINELSTQLCNEFKMKYLDATKKILSMEISRDKSCGKLYFSQKGYIDKVLCCFNMHDVSPASTLLTTHFKLSSTLCPPSQMLILSTCLEFPILVQLVHLCMSWFVLVLIYHMHWVFFFEPTCIECC